MRPATALAARKYAAPASVAENLKRQSDSAFCESRWSSGFDVNDTIGEDFGLDLPHPSWPARRPFPGWATRQARRRCPEVGLRPNKSVVDISRAAILFS